MMRTATICGTMIGGTMIGEATSRNTPYPGASNLRRLPVAPRRWTLLLMAMLIAALAGCNNSGNTANVQNPPPPPAAGVSIAFQSAPPGSIVVNSSTPITAVVSNDSSNAGVDWVLTCQTGGTTCGTLAPPHTASGSPTTYTPPSTLAGNAQIVNIEGFATADQTKNVLASINITAYGNNLSGTYVFAAQGLQNSTTYQIAGAIVLDGNGNITSGQETIDYQDPSIGFTSYTLPIVASGSSYFLGPDGRGTLTLNPTNPNNPSIGVQNFNIVYLSSSHLLIAEEPSNTLTVSASGTMDLQAANITTALTGGYAFVVSGVDVSGFNQLGVGGILNIDNQANNLNNISGHGSLVDQNFAGFVTANQSVTGIVSIPVAPGIVTLTLNFPLGNNGISGMTFTGYLVDANHLKLIETDAGSGFTAGLALGQGSSTGTFSDSSFAGTYVVPVIGEDLANGAASTFPTTFTSISSFTADGAGHFLNGYTDTILEFASNPTTGLPGDQISASFGGNYSVFATGKVGSTFGNFTNPNNAFRPVLDFYLGGDGTALVMMNTDQFLTYPLLATGTAYPQSSTLTFSGNYGFNFTQEIASTASESDGTAIMTAALPSLAGFADLGPSNTDQGFTGTVTTQACSSVIVGCFSGSFVNNQGTAAFVGANAINPNAPVTFNADFYLIDQSHGFFIENDLLQQNTPQVSLGYFETATLPQAPAAAGKSSKTKRK